MCFQSNGLWLHSLSWLFSCLLDFSVGGDSFICPAREGAMPSPVSGHFLESRHGCQCCLCVKTLGDSLPGSGSCFASHFAGLEADAEAK